MILGTSFLALTDMLAGNYCFPAFTNKGAGDQEDEVTCPRSINKSRAIACKPGLADSKACKMTEYSVLILLRTPSEFCKGEQGPSPRETEVDKVSVSCFKAL